jgi:hypothetical protein
VLDRDRIVEATDLGTLADELLGPHHGTARSPAWICPSPNHAQTGRTPPVSVFRSTGGEERWHCHGCGIGGSAVDLVMAVRGATVREAIEELGRRVGVREPYVAERVPTPRRPASGPAAGDLAGLAAFVDDCARRLWQPAGRPVRRWLTEVRGLPEDVLAKNRIGADSGRRRQDRPDGMPSTGWAAVLPVVEDDRPVFAQLRALHPLPDRSRYLNAASRLAPNPRVGLYEPVDPIGTCVIVTEGVLDALSANAAGFRAAGVLGAALAGAARSGDDQVAERLARLGTRVIVAFDSDDAGQCGAVGLVQQLREQCVKTSRLHVLEAAGDLNAWMGRSEDWQQRFTRAVRAAISTDPARRCLSR